VIVILVDDMGFSDVGCYGGEIQTPNIDRLAREGVRFTQFYNNARCCPTRASLMTGLYPHQVGVGAMNQDLGRPAYRGELNDRCVTLGVVGSMTPKIYGNGYRIVQAPGYAVIMAEMIHEARVIPLDGRPHVGGGVRGYLGDSRGHWDGDTLVIETTNFNGKATVPGNNVLASTELKIVERITRVERDLLRYEATITDPKTYTKPYTISIPYTSPQGYQVLPYDCHEGNLAVLQGLGGERVEDKAVEEDAKRGIIRPRRPIQGALTVGGQPIPEGGPR
jgi:arylsulfatase